jgi:hypothetical protein
MTRWTELSALEQTEAAARLVHERELTYRAAAAELGTTAGSIARALRRAPTPDERKPKSRQQKTGDTRSFWTEERLTEPWAQWSARRKAARMGQGSDAR